MDPLGSGLSSSSSFISHPSPPSASMSIRPSLGGGSALPGSRSQPGGYTLVELLIALGIGSLLLTSAYLLYRGSSHLLRLQTLRVEASEARRITRSILGSEIRYLVPQIGRASGRDGAADREARV